MKGSYLLVTAFLYRVPVLSLLFAWLLLGEVPGWFTLARGVPVGSIVMVNRAQRPRRVPNSPRL